MIYEPRFLCAFHFLVIAESFVFARLLISQIIVLLQNKKTLYNHKP